MRLRRTERGVDGRLTLLALLVALAPETLDLAGTDLSIYVPASVTGDPGRYLLGAMGLMYAVSLALILSEVIVPGRLGARKRGLSGLNVVLRVVQGILGALTGILGGVLVTRVSGLSGWQQTASLWLGTLLLALIIALPFLYERRGSRKGSGVADLVVAPASSAPTGAGLAGRDAGDIAAGEISTDASSAGTAEGKALPASSPGIGRGRRLAVQVVLLGAFALDLLLYSLVVPFLPGEAQRLGATPLMTGILFAMYAAGIFAATPVAARLTDRLGPRPTLLWGLIALGGSTLLFAYSPTLSLGLVGLFVARAAQGVASTLTWTAGFAVVAQLHTAEERSRIFARAFTITGLSALIGPPLGGALYALGGFMLPFLVATGLVVLDGLGRLVFLPGKALLPATRPAQMTTRSLLRAPGFSMGLFASLAGALALSSLEPGTPLLLGQTFGLPVWVIGAIFGALALCFVLMQPVVSRSERRLGTRLTLAIGLLLSALGFAGIALAAGAPGEPLGVGLPLDLSPTLVGVVALLGVVGCALALVIVPVPELLTRSGQQLAGTHGVAYGAIYAAYNAAYALGLLLGPLATGAAVDAQGVVWSFLLLAIPPAICALALLVWRTRGKRTD